MSGSKDGIQERHSLASLEVSKIVYGLVADPSPVPYLIQGLREMTGRTAFVK